MPTCRLRIDADFSAAHAIAIKGVTEPLHGHDWHATACVEGDQLDADGLLCDFHLLEQRLHAITSRFHNANLNETPPFDRVNPTAENVARHIAETLAQQVARLPPEAADPGSAIRVVSVRVTEAPGCVAEWVL